MRRLSAASARQVEGSGRFCSRPAWRVWRDEGRAGASWPAALSLGPSPDGPAVWRGGQVRVSLLWPERPHSLDGAKTGTEGGREGGKRGAEKWQLGLNISKIGFCQFTRNEII